MSQDFTSSNVDIDSKDAKDFRRSFVERMERKLESKESAQRD